MSADATGAGRPPAAPSSSIRRDLAAAYLASASRFGSSVVISALLFRYAGAAAFGMFALVRGTIGLLNYTTLGLAPALIHRAAGAVAEPVPVLPADEGVPGSVLAYETPESYLTPEPPRSPLQILYANALQIAFFTGLIGIAISVAYAICFEKLYYVPQQLQGGMAGIVLLLGIGTILRLASDASGGVLQVRHRIAQDNLILAAGDLLWMVSSALFVFILADRDAKFVAVAMLHVCSGAFVFLARYRVAREETGVGWPREDWIDGTLVRSLLGYGLLVVAAQLADYLYAPTDYILINRLLNRTEPMALAYYAPAVQIDSGLLLLVTGLSAVLLPKAAIAHAEGSTHTVRRYYIRGTLASLAMLAAASLCVWAAAPWILRVWLGNPMAGTQAILPLVLIGTTLGGASAVGRSVLLAVGRARAFAISVLIAGVVNAGCSYVFVRFFHLGLPGILLGTVVAVVLRCVFWMPWYVLHTLRRQEGKEVLSAEC
ncbi:MAG TPA: lipopolysaccharide biosynthesis protein [Tepidisphaeraceae bacterium]